MVWRSKEWQVMIAREFDVFGGLIFESCGVQHRGRKVAITSGSVTRAKIGVVACDSCRVGCCFSLLIVSRASPRGISIRGPTPLRSLRTTLNNGARQRTLQQPYLTPSLTPAQTLHIYRIHSIYKSPTIPYSIIMTDPQGESIQARY